MKVLVFPLLLGIAVYAAPPRSLTTAKPAPTHWAGTISNGMPGDKISFDVAADGKSVSNILFQGYWRCSGSPQTSSGGPLGFFPLRAGRCRVTLAEPTANDAVATQYAFDGLIGEQTAQGVFRVVRPNGGCDSNTLQWTAAPVAEGK